MRAKTAILNKLVANFASYFICSMWITVNMGVFSINLSIKYHKNYISVTLLQKGAYCSKKTTFVNQGGKAMNISNSLLYLLLLYAVLDRGNKLSLTTGLVLAFVIMLFNCYSNRCCNNDTRSSLAQYGGLSLVNGFCQ